MNVSDCNTCIVLFEPLHEKLCFVHELREQHSRRSACTSLSLYLHRTSCVRVAGGSNESAHIHRIARAYDVHRCNE